jgi:drug/metabolite transporter (DMT)-like permease
MICWGLSWTSGKILASYGPPENISFLRFALTFVSMLIPLWFTSNSLRIKKLGFVYLLGAAALLSLYTYLFFKGLKVGNAGAGGVLVTTLNPIITYIIVLVINHKKPAINEIAGLIAGLIACLVLLNSWQQPDLFANEGNLFFILATITWSLLSLLTAKAGNFGLPIVFSLWMYGICSIIMGTLSDTQLNINLIKEGDLVFWFNLFFSSTITTSIATTFYFYATSQFGAAKASLYIFLVPLTAAIGSWIFLGEEIKNHTIIGGLLGILAIYLINFRMYQKKKGESNHE